MKVKAKLIEQFSAVLLEEVEQFESGKIKFVSYAVRIRFRTELNLSKIDVRKLLLMISLSLRERWEKIPESPGLNSNAHELKEYILQEHADFWSSKRDNISNLEGLQVTESARFGLKHVMSTEEKKLRKFLIYCQGKGLLLTMRSVINQIREELEAVQMGLIVRISTHKDLSRNFNVNMSTICLWVNTVLTKKEIGLRAKLISAQRSLAMRKK